MALPALDTYCVALPVNDPLCITFPGGAKICAQFPGLTPDPMSFSLSLLGNLNSALAPLQVVFDIINVLVDIVNCVKAVPGILGPPPNPTKLIQCFPQLAKDLAKLLGILPPLSIPLMVAGIIQALLAFLKGLRNQILVILKKLLRLLSAQLRVQVTGSVQLQTAIDCESANLAGFLVAMSLAAEPITCLIALLNALLGLAGLPSINITLAVGVDPSAIEAFLTPLDDIIAVLEAILAGLPIGSLC